MDIADIENVCGLKIPRAWDHYKKVKQLIGDKIVMSQPSEGNWMTAMRDYGQTVHMSSPNPYTFPTSRVRSWCSLSSRKRAPVAERRK